MTNNCVILFPSSTHAVIVLILENTCFLSYTSQFISFRHPHIQYFIQLESKGSKWRSEVHIAVTMDHAVILDVNLCLAECVPALPTRWQVFKILYILHFSLKSAFIQMGNALRLCKMVNNGTVANMKLSCGSVSAVFVKSQHLIVESD
jgi:Tfp pilus assembly protein PilV